MTSIVPRLLGIVVSFLLLLLFDTGSKVFCSDLFTYVGDLLDNNAGNTGSPTDDLTHIIGDLALALDESEMYYTERKVSSAAPVDPVETVINKVELSSTGIGGGISHVAGPWRKNGGPNSEGNTILTGLLFLNETTLVVTDENNYLLRTIDRVSGTEVNAPISTRSEPLKLAKHPRQPYLFLSSYCCIYSVSLESPTKIANDINNVKLIAGSDSPYASRGFADSANSSKVRFDLGMIGAQAVSKNGDYLYVADFVNDAIRRVNTLTGATTTIAGAVPSNGIGVDIRRMFNATIERPFHLALTSDGCNLFVAEWFSPTVHWITFEQPDGPVVGIEKFMIESNNSAQKTSGFASLALSKDGQNLYAGALAPLARILHLKVNTSALRKCVPTPVVPPSPPSSLSLASDAAPPYSQTPPSVPSDASSSASTAAPIHSQITPQPASSNIMPLYVGLSVGVVVLVSCLILAIVRRAVIKKLFSFKREPTSELTLSTKNLTSRVSTIDVSQGESSGLPKVSDQEETRGVSKLAVQSMILFSLSELQNATNGFDDAHLLTGKSGGYGDVYRASLLVGDRARDVAIKVMRGEFNKLKYKQFVAEVNTLGRVSQRNLCKLLGYCTEDDRCILVYPFVRGGSLYDRLHDVSEPGAVEGLSKDPRSVEKPEAGIGEGTLTWAERMSIARQIATGLRYLHHEVEPPILHRDVKSRNILTEGRGEHLHIYLIDFGLATSGDVDEDGHTLKVDKTVLTQTRSGTPGYIAPEYAISWKLTTMNDVYAFGVVLLELLTGRKAVVKTEQGESASLVTWARPWLSNNDPTCQQLMEIIDPRLKSTLTVNECEMANKLAMLAHMCTQDSPLKRPAMTVVMETILNIKQGSQPPGF